MDAVTISVLQKKFTQQLTSTQQRQYYNDCIFVLENTKQDRNVCISTHTVRTTAVEFPRHQVSYPGTASAEYPQLWSHQVSW